MNQSSYKSLVISGGGSLGAWGCGFLSSRFLSNLPFNLVIGTSTGALMAPLVALGDWERLRMGYTSVTNKDIFSLDPFKNNRKVKILNSLWRFINSKLSIGEAGNLDSTIRSFYKKHHHDKLQNSTKEVVIAAFNLQKKQTEYFSSNDYSYNDYIHIMRASSAIPFIMEPVIINGYQYLDGGVTDNVALRYALDRGSGYVEIVIHDRRKPEELVSVSNMGALAVELVKILLHEVREDDIRPYRRIDGVDIITHYQSTYSDIEADPLNFDPKTMMDLYLCGYSSGKTSLI